MARLAEWTEDTCFLMVCAGKDAVCIDRREGAYPVKALTIEVGARRPLGAAAASLVLLVALPEVECERYLHANAERIAHYGMLTADVVRQLVQRARTLGYALNHNNIVPEVSAVGVAVPTRLGIPYAGLSVSALTSRMMQGDRHLGILEWLRQAAREIATQM